MSLLKFEHKIIDLDDVPHRIIEADVTRERAVFLQNLLLINHHKTKIQEVPAKEEGQPSTYNLVTPDVTFNPIVKVYNREIRTSDGKKVTPDYWNQKTTQLEPNYWDKNKKRFLG
ncbi:MAG: hypothetical protein KF860_09510 [Cyclobacteriaceae bacterium]|nr:hypothetical protein [Cyclobacteriaceae bacterium]